MRFLSVCLASLALAAAPAVAYPAVDAAAAGPVATSAVACTTGLPSAFAADVGGIGSLSICTATAQCGSGTVYCEGNTTCTAVDRNCAIPQQGYVDCDGQRTYCPGSCCPCGSCGATRWFDTGSCCANNLTVYAEKRCTTSGWVSTGQTECIVECGGVQP